MACYNATCITPTTGTAPQIFTSALQFFAAAQCLLTDDKVPNPYVEDNEQFDFIIVGAGTAGCVLANRLSEIPDWKILLIEVGDDPPVEAKIPQLDKGMFHTKYDWNYQTSSNGVTNQANINDSCYWPRGKMIGGSSNLNAMIYITGNDHDYQIWHDAGNAEWSVKEVRRCFKKAENFQDMKALKNPEIAKHYGRTGPLTINTFNSTERAYYNILLAAWHELGIYNVPDLNAANVMGSGILRATAANGERQSHNKAYLNPVLHRKNLKIIKNSFATKLLIHNDSKTVYGVKVERDLKIYTYFAKREVIVSAGSINSPHLLMLSGIGPKDHLTSNNIPVVVNSPMVGQNLQDHCIIPVLIYTNKPDQENVAEKEFGAIKYLYNKTGYLAQHSLADILAFYSNDAKATYPLFQSHFVMLRRNDTNIRQKLTIQFGYKDEVINPIIELNKNYSVWILLFNLLHPSSTGNVSVRSNNAKDPPIINANYFKNSKDLELAATGIKIISKVINTRAFKPLNATLGRMHWKECDRYKLDSRDYWKCVCINMVVTVYHPVGTCKMGRDPKNSVVDSHLRVHGVRNLRVIDASIMPSITSGNTNGPTGMIGERGAELVRRAYNKA